MSKKDYKFNIEQKLNDLPFEERQKALKQIPEQLGISDYTFYMWRRIKKSDRSDIPSLKLTSIADFFQCTIHELINIEIPTISMHSAIQSRSKIKSKYKMSTL
ncbi:hypothetical protein [Plebeiibacterium sediminum]|uniref:Uncharacterized protein n=1 Tax=Plebeiibacterium sediminum TaxID=2992112 RepID=A0AAE3M0S8_9BACT|nr:hypothetical protein [Plebeiobacterium sediminum]MCW3784898.1 hypothetical protein [Plebeiobacterium sediminum]